MECHLVEPNKYLMVGWGCCQCRTYNGLQRKQCKQCGHEPCVILPSPTSYGLCDECGVPEGASHVGHNHGKTIDRLGRRG